MPQQPSKCLNEEHVFLVFPQTEKLEENLTNIDDFIEKHKESYLSEGQITVIKKTKRILSNKITGPTKTSDKNDSEQSNKNDSEQSIIDLKYDP